jgi:hypothetical protein
LENNWWGGVHYLKLLWVLILLAYRHYHKYLALVTIIYHMALNNISWFTRRNLVFFHPRTLQLLFDLTIFLSHLIVLRLQVTCCTSWWSILFVAITFITSFIYENNLDFFFNNF